MMENNPVSEMMAEVMKSMKTMIDVNTVVGEPMTAPDGTIIVPITKVTFGVGGGGGEFTGKNSREAKFSGGMGGGGSVKAEAFLVINDSNIRLIPMGGDNSPVSKLVDMVPGVLEKVNGFIAGRKEDKKGSNE